MDSKTDGKKKQTRPRILEIVGPAGAGKSTLYKSLSHYSNEIRLGNFPDVRNLSNAPFFIWYGLQTSLAFLRPPKPNSRKLTRREFAWLSILNGWPKLLRKELKTSNEVIILDQGPVYLLAELGLFGPDFLRSDRATPIWETNYLQWAATLDAIVWLDAPDECLIQRIRNREKDHVVKDQTDPVVFEFLGRYRKMYEHILSGLADHRRDLKVLYFDTGRKTTEEIASQILAEFWLIT